jgi:CBS domain-containing protein
MGEGELNFLIPRLKLAYYAEHTTILEPRSGDVPFLYIIQRGHVGSRTVGSGDIGDSVLGPGECFPIAALRAALASTKVFHATEDTFCYVLSAADFAELRKRSAEFERFCTEAVTATLQQSLQHLQTLYNQIAAEQQSLSRPLRELLRRQVVACGADAPLQDALTSMRDNHVRTIAVVDTAGHPVGVFTLYDLLDRVVLGHVPLSVPISEVMTGSPLTLSADVSAAEAMRVMAERGYHQVAVVEGQKLVGLVTERDLFSLQRVSLREINWAVRNAADLESLEAVAADIRHLTQSLLAQGVAAEPLSHTIASLNDALTRQLIKLALTQHDVAHIEWCWLALGSEGRGEQTFSTDQDNAIIFVADDEAQIDASRSRLVSLAKDVNRQLDVLGFPLCDGGIMASNPTWCLSTREWSQRFGDWIREPTPQALLNANIFFDFRPLYGETTLAENLREWLLGLAQENTIFLRLMVQNALQVGPPLGLIRSFATGDDKSRPGALDLKTRGVRLFVDAARVMALASGIPQTGTAERLRLAGDRLNVERKYVDATVQSFHFLQSLRLRQQHIGGPTHEPNRLDPNSLNEVDQRMLKEAFRQARKLQQRLARSYQL